VTKRRGGRRRPSREKKKERNVRSHARETPGDTGSSITTPGKTEFGHRGRQPGQLGQQVQPAQACETGPQKHGLLLAARPAEAAQQLAATAFGKRKRKGIKRRIEKWKEREDKENGKRRRRTEGEGGRERESGADFCFPLFFFFLVFWLVACVAEAQRSSGLLLVSRLRPVVPVGLRWLGIVRPPLFLLAFPLEAQQPFRTHIAWARRAHDACLQWSVAEPSCSTLLFPWFAHLLAPLVPRFPCLMVWLQIWVPSSLRLWPAVCRRRWRLTGSARCR
jgi:hypothetical protein